MNMWPKGSIAMLHARFFLAFAVAVSLSQGSIGRVLAQTDVYLAECIWTGESEPMKNAALVVRDGLVVEVGKRESVAIPGNARIHDLGNAHLIPGLVIAQTNLVESTSADEFAISPEVRAVDGFDPFGDYEELLAAGITTVQISPGSNRLMPGQGAVVKLASQDLSEQVLREVESLRVILSRAGLSPPTVYEPPVGAVSVERPVEPTKPQLATSLGQARVGLEALFAEAIQGEGEGQGDDEEQSDGDTASDARLQSLASLLKKKTIVRWTTNSNAEIQTALALAGQFEMPWVLVDPIEVDELTSEDVWANNFARGVILNAELRPGSISNPTVPETGTKAELPVWERAKRLIAAGAGDRIALRPATDSDLKSVLFTASILGRGGMSDSQILKTVTSNAARVLGVEDRVGRLESDLDADFVVLSGAPFDPGTAVLATYSHGAEVFKKSDRSDGSTVIRSATIYVDGQPVSDGSLSIVDGKIAGLGINVSAPKGAKIRDFGDAVIVPGMLDCSTTLGLGSTLSDSTGFETKLGELLAREDPQIALGRQGGVTTAFLSSTRLPSPVLAFKLTDSPRPLKDPVALRFEIKGNLTAAETSTQRTLKAGKDYADAWSKYEKDLSDYKIALAKYEAEKKKYDAAVKQAEAKKEAEEKGADKDKSDSNKSEAGGRGESSDEKDRPKDKGEGSESGSEPSDKPKPDDEGDSKETSKKEADKNSTASDSDKAKDEKGSESSSAANGLKEPKKPDEPKKPKANPKLEVYRGLFARKLVAMVDVADVKALELAVEIFREQFDLKTAIVASEAAARSTELLKKYGVFVVAGPALVETDDEGAFVNYPAEIAVAGIPFGFQSRASTGVQLLPDAVSYSVYRGLGSGDALNALTNQTAEFFGLSSIGEIEIGFDADLVVLSGPPLRMSSEVLAVMIDGEWVYEKGEDR